MWVYLRIELELTPWLPSFGLRKIIVIHIVPWYGNLADVVEQILGQNLQIGHLCPKVSYSFLKWLEKLTGVYGNQALAARILKTLPKFEDNTI